MKITLLCLVLCIQMALMPRLGHAQNMPIAYGWVSQAQLSDFAPERLQKSCDLLQQRHFAAAAPGFERELATHPDSLAAYVGLVQAKPNLWPSMRKRLEADVAIHKDGADADTKFKLGALLFYEWGQLPPVPSNVLMARAQTLLTQAWQERPLPIEGMMLIDSLCIGRVSNYPPLRRLNQQAITDQLIAFLGGDRTYALYAQAKRKGWQAQPPPASLVPAPNLKALIGAVRNLRSVVNSRVSYGKIVNGKAVFVDQPYTPSELAEQRYTANWLSSLFRAYQEQIG
jgi:hypothetical protein